MKEGKEKKKALWQIGTHLKNALSNSIVWYYRVHTVHTVLETYSMMMDSTSVVIKLDMRRWELAGKNKGTFGSDGNTLYIDCDDSFKNVHICQNSSIYALKIDAIIFM